MTRKTIMVVFGTRPEALKMAPVVELLKSHSDQFNTVVCVTGQHREMLHPVLQLFDISPAVDLNLMRENQGLSELLSRLLIKLDDVFSEFNPDTVLVQGDTTTTYAAAMAAYHRQIQVGYVESGLRTRNIYSPFPEEINRQLTARIARWHFAPTAQNAKNLRQEGISGDLIHVTGNTVIDALQSVLNRITSETGRSDQLADEFQSALGFRPNSKRTIVVTGHRRENFGDGLQNICEALVEIVRVRPDVRVVYPVHLNPNVQQPVQSILGENQNIHLLPPLEYEPFVYLMNQSYLILTDSGGIQEEAPSLGKPVLVMRDTTERQEAVMANTVRLVGTDKDTIISETLQLLDDEAAYQRMAQSQNPYGDGRAAEKIVDILVDSL